MDLDVRLCVSVSASPCVSYTGVTLNLSGEKHLQVEEGQKTERGLCRSAQPAKCLNLGAGQTLVWVLALRGTCIVTCKLDPETSTFRGFSQGQVNACGLSLQGRRGRISLKTTWKGLAFPAALPLFREERAEQNIGGRRSPPGEERQAESFCPARLCLGLR